MIRDIVDFEGNVIGSLSLPDGTPEEVWQEQLTSYATASMTDEQAWAALRKKRDRLIRATEWVRCRHQDQQSLNVTPTLTDEEYHEWQAYWQALRDLPEQTQDPHNPSFPVQPSLGSP